MQCVATTTLAVVIDKPDRFIFRGVTIDRVQATFRTDRPRSAVVMWMGDDFYSGERRAGRCRLDALPDSVGEAMRAAVAQIDSVAP